MSYPDEPTYDECVNLLRECVAERGEDYVYANPMNRNPDYKGPACLYKHDDEAGCIIGLMLVKHGVPLSRFDSQDTYGGVNMIWSTLFGHHLREGPRKDLLVTVQSQQDASNTWDYALHAGMEMSSREPV